MAGLKYNIGSDYDDSSSRDAVFFQNVYQGANVSYQFVIAGDNLVFASNPNNGTFLIVGANSGFLQDFSDNVATVNLLGGSFGDVLRGGAGNDILNGGAGNDILKGGAGDDVLEGGAGADTFEGGVGIDTVSYEHSTASVTIGLLGQTDGYSNFGDGNGDTWTGIENARGGSGDDFIYSNNDSSRNVVEGAGGADAFIADTNDIVTYEHSVEAVTVNLSANSGSGGEAAGDTFFGVANLTGSRLADSLTGDGLDNALRGGGGADTLHGMGGDDRLVITETPTDVDGGADTDVLFVLGGGTVVLTDMNFADIEKVYVRDRTTLDMSGVSTGRVIVSQSAASSSATGHSPDIIGTAGDDTLIAGKGGVFLSGGAGEDIIRGGGIQSTLSGNDGNDRIVAGSGGALIDGGAGADKLFAGGGSDTFVFSGNYGRDEILRFDRVKDVLDVSDFADDLSDVLFTTIHGGRDTLVTFVEDADTSRMIIVHDIAAETLKNEGHFIF